MTSPTDHRPDTDNAPDPTFEERALSGAPNPLDRIDHLFQNTARRTWWGVVGLAILLAAAVTWTAVAVQRVVVDAPAVVVPVQGIYPVGQDTSGIVSSVRVAVQEHVARGQVLAVVRPAGADRPVHVTSPVAGTVLSVDVRAGETNPPGVTMFRIVPPGRPTVVALYPAAQISRLSVGDVVEVTVNGLAPSAFGRAVGRITDIGPIPVSDQRLRALTGDASLVGMSARLGPLREVQISLTADSTTGSGVHWSGGTGPDGPITIGVGAIASITVDRQTLLERAFGS